MKNLLLVLTFILAGMAANAQTAAVSSVQITNAPRTQFEIFNFETDRLLIKGSSIIGTLNSQLDYPIEIRAERATDPATTNSVYAVSLRTRFSEHEVHSDYIDYDELDTVIRAIQYIGAATATVTPLDNYETVIRTKCGLSIAKLGKANKVTISITPGYYNAARNQIASFDLDDLARYLTAAKAKIDAVVVSGQ
jgi:hypothetical protein